MKTAVDGLVTTIVHPLGVLNHCPARSEMDSRPRSPISRISPEETNPKQAPILGISSAPIRPESMLPNP